MATNIVIVIALLVPVCALLLVIILFVLDICSESWITARIKHINARIDALNEQYDADWHGETALMIDPILYSLKVYKLHALIERYEERLERIRARKALGQANHPK